MSTSALHYGSGSILPSRSGFAASTGGARPARPGQLSQGLLDGLAGGADPETIRELSHTSAAALLDRVHHTEDPEVVARVLTLVDHEGVDVIAELWSHAEPIRCRACCGGCTCFGHGCASRTRPLPSYGGWESRL